mmetsp:Transcript_17497/g.29464  ORF Transcript_17497/g.29464 Transcript_17497/m.29464 type:complete len:217 (-) Transcript_17497:583-1233(-)
MNIRGKLARLLLSHGVPGYDPVVALGAREEDPATLGELEAIDAVNVGFLLVLPELAQSPQVNQVDRGVIPSYGQGVHVIGHESNRADATRILVEHPDAGLLHSDVPDSHGGVVGSAGHHVPIPAEHVQALHLVLVVSVLDQVAPRILEVPEEEVRVIRPAYQVVVAEEATAGYQALMPAELVPLDDDLQRLVVHLLLLLEVQVVDVNLAVYPSTGN